MKEIKKQMSQFLDDELHHHELESLLVKINQKPELKKILNRYQTVSHALRTDEFINTENDFLTKINQQILQEPHHFLPKQLAKRKPYAVWQKVSVAMAASVVCVSIIVSQQDYLNQSTSPSDALILSKQTVLSNTKATAKASDRVIQVAQTQPIANELVSSKADEKRQKSQHERFKAYLQAHSDDLYTYGSLNVQPYASFVGYGQD